MGDAAGAEKSRSVGKSFEDIFKRQAQIQGVFIEKNPTACKLGWNGRPVVIEGELDWKLILKGITGFFDTKTFDKPKFTYSSIKEHQIERAALYDELGVPSGFVVWFREINKVVFYKGAVIKAGGARTSFTPADGKILGSWFDFSIKELFK